MKKNVHLEGAGFTPAKLRVAELREELEARGMSPKGLKADLVERLTKALQDELAATSAEKVDSNEKEKLIEEENNQFESVSRIVHVTGLSRPFTVLSLKQLLQSYGEVSDFWIDGRKSNCFVQYKEESFAASCKDALNGMHWPTDSSPALSVVFAESMPAAEPELSNQSSNGLLDQLFMKTRTEPAIYYKPALVE